MAIYDSYLETGQEILHSVLHSGNGKVGEIIQMWGTKEHKSACLIFLFSVVWYAFQVRGWHLITVLSKLLFYSLTFLYVWSLAAEKRLITWKPPRFDEIMISESAAMALYKKIKRLLAKFYDIAQGKDTKLFFMILAALFLLPYISDYFSFPTFLYLGSFSLLPITSYSLQEQIVSNRYQGFSE